MVGDSLESYQSIPPLDMSKFMEYDSAKLSDDDGVNIKKSHPYQRRSKKLVANATSNDSGVIHPRNAESVLDRLGAFYRFSKAYTLIGTALSVFSVSFLAVEKLSDITPSFFLGVLQAVAGGSLANMYVAGINQLSDVEIDKVNKPYLPLASGKISIRSGILLTALYAILVFSLAWSVNSWPLKLGLFLWLVFGTAYSVDRTAVLNALSICSGQGLIIPILFYLHTQTYVFGRPPVLSKQIIFVSGYMIIHSIVLAIFKDIPDIEGDRMHGVRTFAMQLGPQRAFWICIWLLESAYVAATLIGLSSPYLWIKLLMVLSHSSFGFILWKKANLVDTENNDDIESLYQLLWKLYSTEYLLVPLLRF